MIYVSIQEELQFEGGKKALSVDAYLQQGAITALYGNSGAGKTTVLKIIAGLIHPQKGIVSVNDSVWLNTEQHINVPTQQRSIGFVFQDYALFPNMTVLQNLRYAAGKKRDDSFIKHLTEIVSLQTLLHVKPAQLSGGQQQRAALIRALVRKPHLLLLDEPLAALDNKLRQSLHTALQQLQHELHFTALLVSHDVGEVYTLAKQVIQLQQGEVMFQGTPQQLFAASSLSSKLQLTGEVLSVIQNGVIYIVEVLTGMNIVTITASADEVANVNTGDKVLIYTKAFHVGMRKIM